MGIDFPEGFLFGSATSAYQIEGAAASDGKEDSIWDVFCRVPGAIANGEDATLACDHYHRFGEDVKLLADLGMDTYRFSVSWPRVLGSVGAVIAKGMDFHSRLVNEPVRPLTLMSTVTDALAVPGFEAMLAPMLSVFGEDPNLMRMVESMPLSALVSFSGQSEDAFLPVLDGLNAARN